MKNSRSAHAKLLALLGEMTPAMQAAHAACAARRACAKLPDGDNGKETAMRALDLMSTCDNAQAIRGMATAVYERSREWRAFEPIYFALMAAFCAVSCRAYVIESGGAEAPGVARSARAYAAEFWRYLRNPSAATTEVRKQVRDAQALIKLAAEVAAVTP